MTQLVLDGGTRRIRGRERDCRLLYEQRGGNVTVRLLNQVRDLTPEEIARLYAVPITRKTFEVFRRSYRLDPRRKYYTEEDRREGRRRASRRYYARKQQKGLQPHDIETIKQSDMHPWDIARKYRLSLSEVNKIRGCD